MHILFDLDGTLSNPKVGIINSIKFALENLQVEAPDNLDWCIGPPLLNSFKIILNTKSDSRAKNALELYRQYFTKKGLYQNILYPNIPELLKKLVDLEITLYVATSKPTIYAKRIISHFNLEHYFKFIYGSELNGERSDKKELISYILDKEKLHNKKTMMIGDRKYDLTGAHANNIPSVGVTYGYGSYDELNHCQPAYLVNSPLDILDCIDTFVL